MGRDIQPFESFVLDIMFVKNEASSFLPRTDGPSLTNKPCVVYEWKLRKKIESVFLEKQITNVRSRNEAKQQKTFPLTPEQTNQSDSVFLEKQTTNKRTREEAEQQKTMPLTPEQKKMWNWFKVTPKDLKTHLNGEEVCLLHGIPRELKEMKDKDWKRLRLPYMQYLAFEDTMCTRQSFRASKRNKFESVSKDDAIDLDHE